MAAQHLYSAVRVTVSNAGFVSRFVAVSAEMERHPERAGTHPVAHADSDDHRAAARRHTRHPAWGNAQALGIARVDLDEIAVFLLADLGALSRHVSNVVVVERSSGRENERVLLVGHLGRGTECDGVEQSLAPSEPAFMQESRARMILCRAGPLQADGVDAIVRDAAVARGQTRHLVEDLRRARVLHRIAHCGRHIAHDLPVGPGLPRRIDGLTHALRPPLGVAERAVFLSKTRGGQDDVGQRGRLREEDLLHDQELEFPQALNHQRLIRLAERGIFAHHVEALERPS